MTDAIKRRCILLAGGIDARQNAPRYERNLRWWAGGLKEKGFECWLCLGEASLDEAPRGADVYTGVQRAELRRAFKWLSAVEADGLALVVVSNHGNHMGISLWGKDLLTINDLKALLKPVKSRRVLIMGQCQSGIFGALQDERTAVITACKVDEDSWECEYPPGSKYDEFLYQLGTALLGAPNDAPKMGPARKKLSLQDAFYWAKSEDRQEETPLIFDPHNLAADIYL